MFGLTWSCRGSRLVHFMLNLNESFLKMELNLFWWCLIVVCVICGGIDGVALLHGCAFFVLINNRFYPSLQVTSLTTI